MSAHAGAESIEIERKYEVDDDAVMPGAEAFSAAGFAADAPVTYELAATYYDVPDRALAAAGIAVRQRTGGHDAGWHVKQRLTGGVREIAWPPAAQAPAALFDKLRELLEDATDASLGSESDHELSLVPLAEMRTTRTVTLLRVWEQAVIELADDRVLGIEHAAGGNAESLRGTTVRRAWREWEAELMPGADPALLAAVEPLLLAAGATHSLSFAKIARASGQLGAVAKKRGADPDQIAALAALDASDQERARRLEA